MTRDDAIAVARAFAQEKGWSWVEPIAIARRRRYLLLGPVEWHVVSRSNARGSNVRISIDDASQKIISSGVSPL